MKKILLFILILICVGHVSCIHDDLKMTSLFSYSDVVGSFVVMQVKGDSIPDVFTVGSELIFRSDGTCTTVFDNEQFWKLEDGRVYTYDENHSQALHVYQLIGNDDLEYWVYCVGGNQNSSLILTLKLQKSGLPIP